MTDIQAAAERWKHGKYPEPDGVNPVPNLLDDSVDLANYGVKCLVLVPQLVAALKQIRATAETQQRNRLAGMYGWKTATIDKCIEDNELIQQLDAAIAAGEGR